jgi:thiamine biosynthesis lipoprotein ApbE
MVENKHQCQSHFQVSRDDIEETTADRNEVQIRQLNQTETEEPCDVPPHLTDLLERSKKHLSKEQEIQLIK